MRIFYAKHELKCDHKGCQALILRNDLAVKTIFVRKHPDTNRTTYKLYCYHLACYREFIVERFDVQFAYWKAQLIPRKKMGRPRIVCTDRKKRRQLLSLRIYHSKLGNTERASEIDVEIKALETK
jgi:hypothetical protein